MLWVCRLKSTKYSDVLVEVRYELSVLNESKTDEKESGKAVRD